MERLLIIILMFLSSLSFANNFNVLYSEANGFYEEENYSEAISAYISMIDSGFVNYEIHYNLANCYFRTGQLGYSILHYEKALEQNPNDPDVLHNIKLARSQTKDEFDSLPVPISRKILSYVLQLFPSSYWAIFSFGLLLISTISLLLFLTKNRYRKIYFTTYVALAILGLAFITTGFLRFKYDQNNNFGVLVVPNVYVKSEPKIGEDLFILNEGSKGRIENTYKGWHKIRLSDGNSGWVKSDEFLKI